MDDDERERLREEWERQHREEQERQHREAHERWLREDMPKAVEYIKSRLERARRAADEPDEEWQARMRLGQILVTSQAIERWPGAPGRATFHPMRGLQAWRAAQRVMIDDRPVETDEVAIPTSSRW